MGLLVGYRWTTGETGLLTNDQHKTALAPSYWNNSSERNCPENLLISDSSNWKGKTGSVLIELQVENSDDQEIQRVERHR